MWNNWSWQRKFFIQIGLFFVLIYFGYQFNVKKTIESVRSNRKLTMLTDRGEFQILQDIKVLTVEKRQIDSILLIRNKALTDADLIQNITRIGSNYGVQPSFIEELVDTDTKGWKVEFEGDYISLVKLIRRIERDLYTIKIITADFQKKIDRKSKLEFLTVTLILTRYAEQ